MLPWKFNKKEEEQQKEFIETEEQWLPRTGRWEKWGVVGKRVQTFTYMVNKFWGV